MARQDEWHQLQDRYYWKRELYSMQWKDVDLDKCLVSCAPYGGPIATIRDHRKFVVVRGPDLRPFLQIFTAAGRSLASFAWERGRLMKLQWTDDHFLLCVQDDGVVIRYSMLGQSQLQCTIGADWFPDERIQDMNFISSCETGLVIMTSKYRIYTVVSFQEPRSQLYVEAALPYPPIAWAVLGPTLSWTGTLQVFISCTDGSIVLVSPKGSTEYKAPSLMQSGGVFKALALSANGQYLAGLYIAANNNKALLYVWPSRDLNQILAELDITHLSSMVSSSQEGLSEMEVGSATGSSEGLSESVTHFKSPLTIAWCGNDAVVVQMDTCLHVIGPAGASIELKYEAEEAEGMQLITECDGLRIVTHGRSELLQKVPDTIVNIFKIGSTKPAALLYDASELFEKKDTKSDEIMRSISAEGTERLRSAIDQCAQAAAEEFDTSQQRSLLRASIYGKTYSHGYGGDQIYDISRTVRMLNALRFYEVGIPLTYTQYKEQGTDSLLAHLIARQLYQLAIRICELLNLSCEHVAISWACAKVRLSPTQTDANLFQTLAPQLLKVAPRAFATVASVAFSMGRPRLSTMLLEHEKRATEQVPLLLAMHEDALALEKAVLSLDADLI